MFGGLIFLLATRVRTPHDVPAVAVEVTSLPDAGDAGAEASTDAAVSKELDAGAFTAVERPWRVTSLGWELIAAGVALTTPDGGAIGPRLELAPETSLEAVEARLARGGVDPAGADIAIVPLPAFVQSFDRLRALEPRVFLVAGFSRGREELHAASASLLKPPPAGEEIKLLGLGPATASDPLARSSGSESATFLGLFALDVLGVQGTRVRTSSPSAPEAKAALFSAVTRGSDDPRKLAFSTADASRLIPLVVVAPKSLIDANEPKIRDFARAWLDGLDRVHADASGVARRLAAKENLPLAAGVGAAPEAIAMLDKLGQIDALGRLQQHAWIGPTAQGTLTLATLMQRTWWVMRSGGATSVAAPSPLPIDDRVANALDPVAPASSTPQVDSPSTALASVSGPLPGTAAPLIVYRAADPSADAASVAAQVGFLAGIFEHAAFRVTAKGGEKAARAIATVARDTFHVTPSRLATAPGEPQGAFASVEVLSLP